MFCKQCGSPNNDAAKFCLNCGAPLQQDNADGYGSQFGAGSGGTSASAPVYVNGGAAIIERNLATQIVLSLVTCGIYGLYWLYTLTEDTNRISGDPNAVNGGTTILYSLVTCGIYTYFWMYKRGEIIDNYKMQRGYPSGSLGVLYLVLTFCGLGIVSYALMQNEINKIALGQM